MVRAFNSILFSRLGSVYIQSFFSLSSNFSSHCSVVFWVSFSFFGHLLRSYCILQQPVCNTLLYLAFLFRSRPLPYTLTHTPNALRKIGILMKLCNRRMLLPTVRPLLYGTNLKQMEIEILIQMFGWHNESFTYKLKDINRTKNVNIGREESINSVRCEWGAVNNS